MKHIFLSISCPGQFKDLIAFELSKFGNLIFLENENGLETSFKNNSIIKTKINDFLLHIQTLIPQITFDFSFIEHENWNKVWEKNFSPEILANKYYIKAPFHNSQNNELTEVIIIPSMAFGTGHHETTAMMVELMETIDFVNKHVIDFGCGTGILSIIAEKKGSKDIIAIDNDVESVKSTRNNINLNTCYCIKTKKASLKMFESSRFDIILANINLNILKKYAGTISNCLKENGKMICSGFRINDLMELENSYKKLSLYIEKTIIKNEWAAAIISGK